jgi:hypothetical protein
MFIATQPSRSYFAECKARKVAQKLDDKKISLQEGLNELKELQQIDSNNSSTLELIKKIEFNIEGEKIDRLIKQNDFEGAINVAKRSDNEMIRFRLAEIFVDALLKGLENRSLSVEEMQQLAQWTYELCPHEPAFKPIFRQLKVGSYF